MILFLKVLYFLLTYGAFGKDRVLDYLLDTNQFSNNKTALHWI